MPSNPFIRLQVTLSYPLGHTIQWTVDPTFTGRAPYNFKVYAYVDQTFTEHVWMKDVGENFFAVDDSKQRQNVLDSYLYKVKLTTSDNKEYWSDFTSWQHRDNANRHKYLYAAEISRKEFVRCRMAGLTAYLFKRKMYSPEATTELDPVTGEPVVDTAEGSFGVGITGGYYRPILFPYTLEKFETALVQHPEGRGTTYKENMMWRVPGFPYIEPHDVVVNQEFKRYKVDTQVLSIFPGTLIPIKQDITIQIIPPTETLYDLVVPDFPDDE